MHCESRSRQAASPLVQLPWPTPHDPFPRYPIRRKPERWAEGTAKVVRGVVVAGLLLAGNWAQATAPTIAFSPLTNAQVVTDLTGLGGSVTDSVSVVSLAFSIQELDINGGAGRWWNGTNFQSAATNLPATISGTNWLPATSAALPALNSGQSYLLTAFATNSLSADASANITVQAPITLLTWDPGQTPLGTMVLANPNTNGGNYWFQINSQDTAFGVWRTALNVRTGQAGVYLAQGSPPTLASSAFASANPGSNGFVLDASQFSPGQPWFILVNASPDARWNLVTGDAFIYKLGPMAADASSGTNAPIGAEGMIFFQTTAPANTLAWRLWLHGATNTLYVKKSLAADPVSFELTQAGQMLVVPPYLAANTFNGTYFVCVPGPPATPIQLDSRQQPVTLLPFNSATNIVVTPNDFPYVTYRVDVPVQQIAWQLNLAPSAGAPNLAVRRDLVANEFRNHAFSEPPAHVGASVSLAPPPPQSGAGVAGLSDGTFFVTLYSGGPYTCAFTNGNPVITDVPFVFSATNDAPNRVGWRYYRVLNIAEQVGTLNWLLALSNQVAGTEIALRRNAVPGQWDLRDADDNSLSSSLGYMDDSNTSGQLLQTGHQADIWYLGVYMPTNALGSFVLTGSKFLPPPPPTPQVVAFDGAGNTASVTNQGAGTWRYFQITVPADPSLLGWDLRLTNVTGSPALMMSRDAFPTALGTGPWTAPWTSTTWPSTYQWQAGVDWTGENLSPDGSPANVSTLAMGVGNPLQPGTYFAGIFGGTSSNSYTLASRGIATNGYGIMVHPLGFVDSVAGANLPREAAYYQVTVPTNTPNWRVKLAPTVGDALLLAQKDFLPNVTSGGSAANPAALTGGIKMQKTGNQHYLLLPYGGQSSLVAGTYYLGVVSEGVGSSLSLGQIGSNSNRYVLSTLSPLSVTNLGTASMKTDLTSTQSLLEGGDVAAYQFTMPAGLVSDTARVELTVALINVTGNPQYAMQLGTNIPSLGGLNNNYGVEGGTNFIWSGVSNVLVNPSASVYTLMVQSSPADTSYTLQVHLNVTGPTTLAFDGSGNSVSVANQPAGQWRYFQVVVPSDPNLLGWDIRLTNVMAGAPALVVSRDTVPVNPGTSPWGTPWQSSSWPSNYQWQAGIDWTGQGFNIDGTPADVNTLAMGMGNPLQAGTYYVGVYDANNASSFTVVSRGIGLSGYSLVVHPLGLVDSVGGTSLPPREAAYYQVTVPANTPSWRVKLAPSVGDALLLAQKDSLPNVVSGGFAANPGGLFGGIKMQKAGNQHYLLLPYAGQSSLVAGTYYLGVVSEGVNSTPGAQIGSNTTTYVLSTLAPLPAANLGTAAVGTDLLITNALLEGGDVAAYQFTMPTGLVSNTVRVELTVALINVSGNPVYALQLGTNVPALINNYGTEGGTNATWVGVSNVLVNPAAGVYTLAVQPALADAAYTVQIHLQVISFTTLAFDGPGSSVSVANLPPGLWRFFQVVVPSGDPNLLGWDLRLTNVTAGTPVLVACRDQLPVSPGTSFGGGAPWTSTSWPSGYQWQAAGDWTGEGLNVNGADGKVSTLAMGVGNPLQPGTYYVGVYDQYNTNSFTVVSRGIGLSGFSIPVNPVGFAASTNGVNLPPREAAYYQVTVTNHTPSWRAELASTVGDALLLVQKDFLPNVISGGYAANPGGLFGGIKMQKAGHQHYVLLPYPGQTNLVAGTYYLGVVSEGVNSNPGAAQIGSNTTSYAVSSLGTLPVANLGTAAVATDLTSNQPLLEGGDVAAYQFVVPTNLMGLEVRLENRVGNPQMTLFFCGTGIASPYPDNYGAEGGQSPCRSDPVLITIPNPEAGIYSLVVKASSVSSAFLDAAYNVRVHAIVPPLLNITRQLNTNGVTNVATGILADNERAFYQVTVPDNVAGAPVLGWNLFLSETNGAPSIRVRQNLLPDDTCDSTWFLTGSSIIAAPFLTPGTWYVEVKGSGYTAFTVSSSAITTNTMQRPPWLMPAVGQTPAAAGMNLPFFSDTGVDGAGNPLSGDQGVDLWQGHHDFYAVIVPTNNAGLLRTELQAISGNPQLHLRVGAAPTLDHYFGGSCCPNSPCPFPVDRQLVLSGTQYGNWVPLNGQTETELTPGIWVISVFAAGNSNVRYRLRLSCGAATPNGLVQDLPLDGTVTYNNQGLAGGDWRYYRMQLPRNAPNQLAVSWTRTGGNAQLFIRDTVPPGDGRPDDSFTGKPQLGGTWASDNKNQGPYPSNLGPGLYTLTTPPLRPGAVYYLGFTSPDDSLFSVTCSTNGGTINITNTIAFNGGSVAGTLLPQEQATFRIDVPPQAWRWASFATNDASVGFFLEQGTVAQVPSQHWHSSGANSSWLVNLSQNNWPWVPGQSYYLLVTNGSGAAQTYVFGLVAQPLNDNFTNRFTLTGTETQTSGNNFLATAEPGEPAHNGAPAAQSVWWTWTAPVRGQLNLDTLGSDFATRLAIYTGAAVNRLTTVAPLNATAATDHLQINVNAGTEYQIAVDGDQGATGNIVLNLGGLFPPVITQVPLSQTASAGADVQLTSDTSTPGPLNYSWLFNGVAIPGAATSFLLLTNVSATNSGDYQVEVSNAVGMVTSAVAVLKVAAGPITSNLVVHLTFDGNLNDSSGRGNHATYAHNGVNGDAAPTFVPSPIGQAFQFTTLADGSKYDFATFGYPVDLQLGASNDFSVSMWLNYTNQIHDLPFISNKNWVNVDNVGWGIFAQGIGNFRVNAAGPKGSSDQFDTYPEPILRDGRWHHLVVNFVRSPDPLAGYVESYVDGYLVDRSTMTVAGSIDTTNLTFTFDQISAAAPIQSSFAVNLGQDGAGVYTDHGLASNVGALMDDLGIWRRALTPQEVASVYVQGLAGKDLTAASGAPVDLPPAITLQPLGETVSPGSAVQLWVEAGGTGPLTYQWQKDGASVGGATNQHLLMASAQLSDLGNYWAIVSNAGGSTTSQVARLVVFSGAITQGLVVHLTFDGNLNDSSGRGNHATYAHNGSQGDATPSFVPGVLGQAFQFTTRPDGSKYDYATFGYPTDLQFGATNDLAVSLWVNFTNNTEDVPFISNKDWDSSKHRGWGIFPQSGGNFRVNATGPGYGDDRFSTRPATLLRDGNWHNLIVSFVRGPGLITGYVESYVDGLLVDRAPLSVAGPIDTFGLPFTNHQTAHTAAPIQTAFAVNLGQDGTGVYNDNGYASIIGAFLDDLGIWRRALTAQEAASIYTQGLAHQDLTTASGNPVALLGAAPYVGFHLGDLSVEPGALVNAPVTVTGFTNVTTAQFTLAWDPAVLQFQGSGNYGLPSLDANSLNLNNAASGTIAVSWDDIQADTRSNGATIFALSFLAIGTNGATSALSFIDTPTPPEASVNLGLAGFAAQDGLVRVHYLPPVITAQPQSVTVGSQANVSFAAGVASSAPVTYQWQRAGANLPNQTSTTLNLNNVHFPDAGGYSLVASNLSGMATSQVAFLTFTNTPPLLAPIPDQTINPLSILKLTISATDLDLPYQNLTYTLVAGPAGASLDANSGVLTWTPTGVSVPSTNLFTVRVTDNGTLPLSDTKSFTVVVSNASRSIGGTINYYAGGLTVPGVTVNLSGDDTQSTNTDQHGVYSFTVRTPGNYTVSPVLATDNPPAQGVTTLDIHLIRLHILATIPFTSPYQLLAADANNSGSVSTLDLVFLRQLVLGISNNLPAGLWKFIPSDFQFTNSLQPWFYSQSRQYTNLANNATGQDFVGIKIGDVNHSWTPPGPILTSLGPTGQRGGSLLTRSSARPAVTFQVGNPSAKGSASVVVPISVAGFNKVTSAQFTLQWDPAALRFAGTESFGAPGLDAESFGTAQLGEGRLTFSWDDLTGLGASLPDGAVLFTVRFRIAASQPGRAAIAFTDSPTPREVSVNSTLATWFSQAGSVEVPPAAGLSRIVLTPKLSPSSGTPRELSFSLPTVAGKIYVLEATDSLAAPNWQPVTEATADGATLTLTAPVAATSQRFYRVRIE